MDIVNQKQIHEPNLILNELNRMIRYMLKQDQTQTNDGMDVSICSIFETDRAR